MTREEAIGCLSIHSSTNGSGLCTDKQHYEAKQIAVEALEQTRWIPVSERMPEEHEWIGTKRFGTTISDEVYVTLENSKGERYTQHLRFQNGKLSAADQSRVDTIFKGGTPIACMPFPKPYEPQKSEK